MGFVDDLLRRLKRLTAHYAHEPRAGGAGIVDYLNVRRPQRARRLFTDLFAPVLAADDPVLLRAPRPLPGLVQRVDLGGLWAALECFALLELTSAVQSALDARAADTLLDDVLKSPEALDGRRRMGEAAGAFLGSLPAEGGLLTAFLDLLNRERLSEAHRLAPGLGALVPLGPGFLRFIRDYLAVTEGCAGLAGVCGADSEATAERLGETADAMRPILGGTGGAASELPHLVPLTALHVGRHYGAVALMARDHGRPRPVLEALLGHFSACCAALGERVVASAGDAEGILGRLTLIMPALIVAGVVDDPECAPLFRAEWRRLVGLFEDCLAAAPGRSDAAELLDLIGGWYQLARTYDQEVAGLGGRLEELKIMLEAR